MRGNVRLSASDAAVALLGEEGVEKQVKRLMSETYDQRPKDRSDLESGKMVTRSFRTLAVGGKVANGGEAIAAAKKRSESLSLVRVCVFIYREGRQDFARVHLASEVLAKCGRENFEKLAAAEDESAVFLKEFIAAAQTAKDSERIENMAQLRDMIRKINEN